MGVSWSTPNDAAVLEYRSHICTVCADDGLGVAAVKRFTVFPCLEWSNQETKCPGATKLSMNHVLWQAPNFLEGPNHFLNLSITFGGAGHPFRKSWTGALPATSRGGGRTRTTHFLWPGGVDPQNFAFLNFFWKVFAPTPGISLFDRENSSREIIFESVHIYPEFKHLKE